MLLSIGLLAMCFGVAVGIISVVLPRMTAPVALSTFLHYAAVAGVLAVGATVMYLMHTSVGGRAALVVADGAMVISPAVMGIGVRGFAPRARRLASAAAVACGVGIAACTALLDESTSLALKAAVLCLICAASATAALTTASIPPRTARTIGSAMVGYAIYSGARFVVGTTVGWDSPLGSTLFSPDVAAAVAVAAVLVCGAGVIMMIHPAAPVPSGGPQELTVVVIDDARLLAQAYGDARLRELVTELRAAARALDDRAVDVRHGVATALPDALATLTDRMLNAFGWALEDVALLAEPPDRNARPDRR